MTAEQTCSYKQEKQEHDYKLKPVRLFQFFWINGG